MLRDKFWTRNGPNLHQINQWIANKIVAYCYKLASILSSSFETGTGHAIDEPFLKDLDDASHPSWIPRLIGPFSSEGLASHLPSVAPGSRLDVGDKSYYYHADLGPTNVVVLEGTITGILDWESAAYYPKFWIATKSRLSAGFCLQKDRTDRKAWSNMLGDLLEASGFVQSIDEYNSWRCKSLK